MAAMTLQGASVLVAGATGFLGSHLVRRLVSLGARVQILARPRSALDRIADVKPRPPVLRAELSDAAGLATCVRSVRPDIVFLAAGSTSDRGRDQTAGQAGDESYQVNLIGTHRFLRAIAAEAPRARVIRLGSIAEYGTGPCPFKEEQREQPASPYAASLVAATHLGQAVCRQSGLAVTTLRLALTYGPGQGENFLIPSLISACLDGRPFELSSASSTRDIVYVGDVVDALLASAVADGLAGEIVNVGSGRESVVRDLAATVIGLVGSATELRESARPPSRGEPARLVFDPSRARQLLGWQAQTPIELGLERTIAWYRAARML